MARYPDDPFPHGDFEAADEVTYHVSHAPPLTQRCLVPLVGVEVVKAVDKPVPLIDHKVKNLFIGHGSSAYKHGDVARPLFSRLASPRTPTSPVAPLVAVVDACRSGDSTSMG